MNNKIDVQMNFCRLFPFIERKKLNPGISRDGDQFCPVIPGYGKASKILNPSLNTQAEGCSRILKIFKQ